MFHDLTHSPCPTGGSRILHYCRQQLDIPKTGGIVRQSCVFQTFPEQILSQVVLSMVWLPLWRESNCSEPFSNTAQVQLVKSFWAKFDPSSFTFKTILERSCAWNTSDTALSVGRALNINIRRNSYKHWFFLYHTQGLSHVPKFVLNYSAVSSFGMWLRFHLQPCCNHFNASTMLKHNSPHLETSK